MSKELHNPPARDYIVRDIEVPVDGWDIPHVIQRLARVKDELGDKQYRMSTSDYGITIFYDELESEEVYKNKIEQWELGRARQEQAEKNAKLKRYKQFINLKREFELEAKNDIY